MFPEVVGTASENKSVEFMSYHHKEFLVDLMQADDVVPSVRSTAMKAYIRQGTRRAYNHPITRVAETVILGGGGFTAVMKSAMAITKTLRTGQTSIEYLE